MTCSEAKKYDVGFVLDVSTSIGLQNWIVEKTFTKKLARVINISPAGGRAGVVIFSQYAYLRIKLNQYTTYNGFAGGVDRLSKKGAGTSIGKGLKLALEQLFTLRNGMRSDAEKQVVLITDGQDKNSAYHQIARRYRARNIKIIIIGVGSVNKWNLRKLVASDKDLYIAKNFDELKVDSFAENVGETICNGII